MEQSFVEEKLSAKENSYRPPGHLPFAENGCATQTA
jgi:hypothetical protein